MLQKTQLVKIDEGFRISAESGGANSMIFSPVENNLNSTGSTLISLEERDIFSTNKRSSEDSTQNYLCTAVAPASTEFQDSAGLISENKFGAHSRFFKCLASQRKCLKLHWH